MNRLKFDKLEPLDTGKSEFFVSSTARTNEEKMKELLVWDPSLKQTSTLNTLRILSETNPSIFGT
jgi:hypothetical protein